VYRSIDKRVTHRAETLQHVQSAIATRTVEQWNAALTEVGIPCSPINTLAQLLEHPHTRANKTIMQYDHAAAGRLNCVGHPVTFVGEERSAGLPPPMLGQHTDEILRQMGLSPETIEGLRREDVVS
jgi:crotonobetainyl-CoA:carnitine CoA-transferase CaiB-like acyl-CoA transferase